MADLTRRAFLGKTLLTGATIALGGGLSTTSTTPVKPVATATATTWKNLNVLSPKAKAYRTFLRGISASAGFGKANRKSLITPERIYTARLERHDRDQAVRFEKSPGRRAFETAIEKPKKRAFDGTKYGKNSKKLKNLGVGNPSARKIAQKIAPIPRNTTNPAIRGDFHTAHKGLTAKITKDARSIYAQELRSAQEHKVGERMYKKKRRGYGGGGGKHMIDGVETPRNPTGMSLLNRKSILM